MHRMPLCLAAIAEQFSHAKSKALPRFYIQPTGPAIHLSTSSATLYDYSELYIRFTHGSALVLARLFPEVIFDSQGRRPAAL
jgi:hypothetical protein